MPQHYQNVAFTGSLPRVTAVAIRHVEDQLGVVFPDDYRAFLLAVNGGIPTPIQFDMAKPGRPGEQICVDFFYGVAAAAERRDLRYEQQSIIDRTDSIPMKFR